MIASHMECEKNIIYVCLYEIFILTLRLNKNRAKNMRKYNSKYVPSFCVGDCNDNVADFVGYMEWDVDKLYPAFELWLMYADYCRERGMMPCTQYLFSRKLVSLGYEKFRKTAGMAFRMVISDGGSEAMVSAGK